jgi:CHAD domain-containing protein
MGSKLEIEAKFDADADWRLPEPDGVVTHDLATTELVAVYWDTVDRRLDDWGVTLRRRVADDEHVEWTVKLPVPGSGDGVQRRQELNVDDACETPPAELRTLVTAMTRGTELAPIAELRTERRRQRVGDDLWSDAVEITDDRVTSRVQGRPGPSFRQIEVELLDHDAQDVMDSVVDALRDAGLKSSTDASKLRRVLGAATGTRREELEDAGSMRGLTATSIGRSLDRIVRTDPWIRLADDVEAVHTCRKAVRRLRSDLRTLRKVLDAELTEPLRDELKWFGALLGEVRDLHVLREQLVELADDARIPVAELDPIVAALDAQLAIERGHLLSAMEGDRYLALISRATEFEHHVPLRLGTDAEDPTEGAVATAGRRAWKTVDRARHRVDRRSSSERLHTLRKKVKRARAAAQLAKDAAEASGSKQRRKSAKKFAKAAGSLKDQLGDLHDADVLVAWLDEHARSLEPDAAYCAGQLREHALQRRHELDREWVEAWDDLDRKRRRRWMR